MHISHDQMICGYRAIDVRNLLRAYSGGLSHQMLCDIELHPLTAQILINRLLVDGYIEQDTETSVYRLTIRGNALRMASATKQIRRQTAEHLVTKFLERVRILNDNPDYLFEVRKVLVFGSYLTDTERLSDIDLACDLEKKNMGHDEFMQRCQHRIHIALEAGRYFSTIMDQRRWPRQECKLFLKGRSRALSLHSLDQPVLLDTKSQVLFDVSSHA